MLTKVRRGHETAPDERVAALLAAAAAPAGPGPAPGEAPGEAEALAAFRAAGREAAPRRRMIPTSTPLKTAAAAAMASGLLLTGGVAAAATGSLPSAAQNTAHDVLAKVGVTVPGADDHANGHADRHGSSGSASEGQRHAGADHAHSGHGPTVSKLARSKRLKGDSHGAAVSGYASNGHSHAGQHGAAGDHGKSATRGYNARVDTPNKGGADHPQNSGQNPLGGTPTLPDSAHNGIGSPHSLSHPGIAGAHRAR